MRERKEQLYTLTSANFRMPHYVDQRGSLVDRPAENLPVMQWPGGRWCHDANTYLRELFDRNLSRRNRGGSISVVAAHITHLIRYCWHAHTDLIALTDNQFTEFMTELHKEKRSGPALQKARDANTVIAIGRDCLSLLTSVATKHSDPEFIGPSGRIRVTQRQYVVHTDGDSDATIKRTYWHHASFPQPDPKRRRMPIETKTIVKLRAAVPAISKNAFLCARRRIQLLIFEIVGVRRGEAAEIEVDAVRSAAGMEQPMLKVITLKKRTEEPPVRYIPISKADVVVLMEYIEIFRRSVIRRAWGKADHGKLLVCRRTGAPLRPNTVSQEIKRLAKAAKISQVTCPQMFRHRFITKIFVALIERHRFENPDEFRRMLLSTEKLKAQVLEWTGHASTRTLSHYINLAFEEVAEYKKTSDHVRAAAAIDSFTSIIQDEISRLAAEPDPIDGARRIQRLAEALREDLLSTLHKPTQQ